MALLLCGPGGLAAQFSAQPVILEIRTSDEPASTTVAVRNEGEDPLQLRIYAADFDQPAEGGHAFIEPGQHPRSCTSRLRFYPDNLLLEAGAVGEVRVVMDPAASTCWSMLFVQSVSRGETGIRIAQRIGIKVYGLTDGVVPEGEIRSVAVGRDRETGRYSATIDFENAGEGPVRPEGEIEIRTEEGEVVAVVPVAPFSVLPGRVRRTIVPVEARLVAGRYLAIPILDFGGDYLAGGQAIFEVEP